MSDTSRCNSGSDRIVGMKGRMFTGIITDLGKIAEKTDKSLAVSVSSEFLSKLKKGTSVSINGICLTVINSNKHSFAVDVMSETADRTNIRYLKTADLVNLELPATPSSFLSGHIVQGHVDGIGKIEKITSQILKVSVPLNLAQYLIEKGSVAINGISLTVTKTEKNYFTVGIVPYTWNNTMLHTIKIGNFVNIEVDILAKYVKKYCHYSN